MNSNSRPGRKVAFKPIEIRPASGWPELKLAAVWRYSEIIYVLALRDIKVRYKQSLVGFGWAIVQPLLTMIVFTAIFSGVVKVPTGGSPYPLFSLCALVPWSYFVHALNMSTGSLVGNEGLINRVYFPRLVLPLSAIAGGLVDFMIAFTLLLFLLIVYGEPLTAKVLFLPIFVALAVSASFALGLWLSAINVQYRDVRNALPFFTQILMFISPVAYPSNLIPEKWQFLYNLNPMAAVINGFRWALLEDQPAPNLYSSLTSVAVVFIALVGGLYFFRWQENRFADII